VIEITTKLGRFTIREATPADAPAIARLHVETFRETHGGGPTLEIRLSQWTDILSKGDPNDFAFLVIDADQTAVGFTRGVVSDGREFHGVLNKIYLLRRVQKHGLGRAVLHVTIERFVKMGLRSMHLNGWAENPNNGFYEHFGGERLVSPDGEFHGGYVWNDLPRALSDHF